MAGRTARALRQRLRFVVIAVALVLLTAACASGGHNGLLEEVP